MNIIVAGDEKFEAQLNCKIIATTVWESERDVIITIFVYPYPMLLCGGFVLFHLLISFFCSDLFNSTIGKKNPKHILNVVWISSQKMTKSSQLRTPSLDSY